MREVRIRQMLDAIETEARYAGRLTGRPTFNPRVLSALAEVPREEFVPPEMRPFAYDNRALPIEGGQTISQPFIVALMTDLLDPEPDDVILEVGTGSGYQAAVLSRLVKKVYSIEVVPELAVVARDRLRGLGFTNVEVRAGDGYAGWPELAPFDGIIVTAAAPHIPPPLVDQLGEEARLVIPVGPAGIGQELMVVQKEGGEMRIRDVLSVVFVPLTGRHGKEV